jgi:hypothetical protein
MTPGGEEKAWLAIDDRSSSDDLPEDLQQLVKPELQPGESLLWASMGRERPPGFIPAPVRSSAFAVLSLGTSAGAAYLMFGPLRLRFERVDGLVTGIGLIAFVAGLISAFVAFCTLLDKWWPRGRIPGKVYALTDRRAIIWVPIRGSQAVEVHTYTRGSVRSIHRLEYPDGSGSVRFDYPTDEFQRGPSGFEEIADVRRVEVLARGTLIEPDADRHVSNH